MPCWLRPGEVPGAGEQPVKLFHSSEQCALQRGIEPAGDCGNLFVVKLTEQGRRLIRDALEMPSIRPTSPRYCSLAKAGFRACERRMARAPAAATLQIAYPLLSRPLINSTT
jgi:hypothetical protein